jgi:hypothetical protein
MMLEEAVYFQLSLHCLAFFFIYQNVICVHHLPNLLSLFFLQ